MRLLEREIQALQGIERLKHTPRIWNEEVGDQIANQFQSIRTIPLLAFIDPWGYKGLTLRLVDRPFLARNYKAVLSRMHEEGLIRTHRFPKRRGTFADDIRVTFPDA